MNDFKSILHYMIIIKKRELMLITKNLYIGLLIVIAITFFSIIQLWRMVIQNINLLYHYRNIIVLGFTIVTALLTILYRKTPIKFHPATMINFSGDKFQKIIVYKIYKKLTITTVLGFLLSFVLVRFRMNLHMLIIGATLWNIFFLSFIVRYITYHQKKDIRSCCLLLFCYIILNASSWGALYIKIISVLIATIISIYYTKKIVYMPIDYNKLFVDLVYINKANYLARRNDLTDAQEFSRELLAERNRKIPFDKIIAFKNPLIKKNLITFFRINLFVPFYIFAILLIIIFLYEFEPFDLIRVLKNNGVGIQIVALHQAFFINTILDIIVTQKNLLIYKSKEGLYLPFNNIQITCSFIVLALPIILLEIIFIGLLFKVSIISIFLTFTFYSITFFIYLSLGKKKKKDIYQAIAYIAIFLTSIFFIN